MAEPQTGKPVFNKPYHHGNLAQTLMDVTLELIKEQGAGRVSLREAAKRAGVSSSAPFNHFKNKDELFSAICAQSAGQMRQTIKEALDKVPEGDIIRRLETLARSYMDWVFAQPERFTLLEIHNLQKSDSLALGATTIAGTYIRDTLVATLEQAREKGMLREDVDIRQAVMSARALGPGLAQVALDAEVQGRSTEFSKEEATNALVQFNRLLCKPSVLK